MTSAANALRVLVVGGVEPWPLTDGGRLHLYHVLRTLARECRLTLALTCLPQHADALPPGVCVEVMDGDARRSSAARPVSLALRRARRFFGYEPAVATWLQTHARAERFDVALVHAAPMGVYLPDLRAPAVWDPVDELALVALRRATDTPGFEAWTALRDAAWGAVYERAATRYAAATVFVAPLDASYARRWCGGAAIHTIPNGVDLDALRPQGQPTPGTVAFVGALDFPPNIEAVEFLARRVWPQLTGVARELLIVGRHPVPSVQALAAVPGVRVVPDVPDVRPYLASAAVVVVPTRLGGGIKNKVLEACAMGRPVVAHPHACQGLRARVGRDLLVAEDPATWARAVAGLLTHPERAAQLGRRGRAWVCRHHDWNQTGRQFAALLTEVARTARPARSSAPVLRNQNDSSRTADSVRSRAPHAREEADVVELVSLGA